MTDLIGKLITLDPETDDSSAEARYLFSQVEFLKRQYEINRWKIEESGSNYFIASRNEKTVLIYAAVGDQIVHISAEVYDYQITKTMKALKELGDICIRPM